MAQDSDGVTHSCNSMGLTCKIEGLRCSTNYTAYVIASNFICNSSESEMVTIETGAEWDIILSRKCVESVCVWGVGEHEHICYLDMDTLARNWSYNPKSWRLSFVTRLAMTRFQGDNYQWRTSFHACLLFLFNFIHPKQQTVAWCVMLHSASDVMTLLELRMCLCITFYQSHNAILSLLVTILVLNQKDTCNFCGSY